MCQQLLCILQVPQAQHRKPLSTSISTRAHHRGSCQLDSSCTPRKRHSPPRVGQVGKHNALRTVPKCPVSREGDTKIGRDDDCEPHVNGLVHSWLHWRSYRSLDFGDDSVTCRQELNVEGLGWYKVYISGPRSFPKPASPLRNAKHWLASFTSLATRSLAVADTLSSLQWTQAANINICSFHSAGAYGNCKRCKTSHSNWVLTGRSAAEATLPLLFH